MSRRSIALEAGDLVRGHRLQRRHAAGRLPDGGAAHLGFDPSDVSRYAIEKGYDVVNDFFSIERLRAAHRTSKSEGRSRSIAMFYDLEHPRTFVRDVPSVLAEDGIWVIELHYLPMMLEANAFDAIVHEHLEYYSLAVIERLRR